MKKLFLGNRLLGALLLAAWFVAPQVGCANDEVSSNAAVDEDLNGAYEELQATEGKEDGATCSGVRPPDSGPFGNKIAITFDDGPSLTTTPKVLEILARHNVKATFFVLGKHAHTAEQQALLRQMAAAGHILGNHSYHHYNSKTVSSETWTAEVEDTNEILAGILSEFGEKPAYFRFPYGSANCSTYGIVTTHGYHVTGWHIDSGDWCFQSSKDGYGYCSPRTFRYVPDEYRGDITGWVLHQARTTHGGILLFHDIHSFTVDHLDEILTALENDGFAFTTLADTETFPLLNGVEPPHEPWIGDPCESNEDCAFDSGGVPGFCFTYDTESDGVKGFCSLPCEGYCPDLDGTAPTFCVQSLDPAAGMCVSKAYPINESCGKIPGTAATEEDRFVGSSSAAHATALVCMPQAQ